MLSERDAAPAGTMNEGTRDEQSLGRRHIIERPRLTRLLDECEARVILLVAPAGYGKTTLAREWTTGSERSASWCTLAVGAGDIAVSSQLLGVALDRIAPGAASRMTSRLRHSSGPQSEPVDLARVLAAGVESWPPDSWLVIDDYHAGANDVTDRFFEEFVNQCGQVLITSRQRPRWATSRRLMYGEFYELGAAALAMTHEEAFEVLGSRGAESRGFFALADGWPAVIGLGAMANPSIVAADRTPEDLHDFLAQEVLSTISEEAQGAVCRLALLPTLEDAAVAIALGDDALVVEATNAGLLARRGDAFELHPLLRVFLKRKLRSDAGENFATIVRNIGEALLAVGRWNDALLLAEEHGDASLIESSLEAGLANLLRAGRLESIRRAADAARRGGSTAGIVELAEAEVALREGHASKARTLAESALERLPAGDDSRSRALLVMGRSAHQSDAYTLGLEAFSEARAASRVSAERRDALWGMFLCACQLDLDVATSLLEEYSEEAGDDVDSVIRVGIGRQVDGERRGSFRSAVDATSSLVDLLRYSQDPLVRSSFLSGRARMLALMSRYHECLPLVRACHDIVREDELRFALPSTYATEAIASAGLRRYKQSLALLSRCETEAAHLNDIHNQVDAASIRCRVLCALGRFESALAEGDKAWRRHPGPVMWAEYIASCAFAAACLGRRNETDRRLAESGETASNAHTRLLAALSRAVLAIQSDSATAAHRAAVAVELALDSDHIDGFVTAYRAVPELAARVAVSHREELQTIYQSVPDAELRSALGISTSRPAPPDALTAREEEVFALLREGLTNREIAKRLFISEVTVKVHMRHIYAKLGVRTRTQAVLARDDPTPLR
jgi:LuxR family maltose regulon positive regulatory protein